MKKQPLVSVIIPIYNIEEYLPQCIESVINQTYKNIEIILVNDGSTDSSENICNEYAGRDKRIKVIHQGNYGLVKARKNGFDVSKGSYIFNIDGDDWVEAKAVEMMMNALIDNNVEVVQMGYYQENLVQSEKKYRSGFFDTEAISRETILKDWMEGNPILDNQIFNKLYSRNFFDKVYSVVPEKFGYGEDCISFLYCLNHVGSFYILSGSYYHYRIRNTSLSHKKYTVNWLVREEELTNKLYHIICSLNLMSDEDYLNKWLLKRNTMAMKKLAINDAMQIGFYSYSDIQKISHKKIVIYGAGDVGRDLILQLSKYDNIQISGWVDKNCQEYNYSYRKVNPVEYIRDIDFDYIIVALYSSCVREKIFETLVTDYHISPDKIIWKNDYC